MSEPGRVAAALRRLATLGVRLSMDDFGTGYSSLSSVRALPLDELKIDRSFVTNAAEDANDESLIRSITQLGHGLGLRVIAEGVEDERVLALLHRTRALTLRRVTESRGRCPLPISRAGSRRSTNIRTHPEPEQSGRGDLNPRP